MNYIVLDLEFNQDFSSMHEPENNMPSYPFEIIQVGAVRLDEKLESQAIFNRYVKPTIYQALSPTISALTGITALDLQSGDLFPVVYKDFIEFMKGSAAILGTWGMSDIKELFKNAFYHQLDTSSLTRKYIDIQPLASLYLGLPKDKLLRLQYTVEALNIPITEHFHNALFDAYYTVEIFKKIYHPGIQPKIYDPEQTSYKQRKPKRIIDYASLLKQFEKMYQRKLTEEEENMIKLAYKMGKTHQFLK